MLAVPLASLSLFFLAGAIGIGALLGAYQTYANDYVPIEQKVLQHDLGLTAIYDRGGPETGQLLGTLTNLESPLVHPVALSDISPYLVQATVSTEDNSFYSNPGVDPKGLLRAAWDNYTGGGIGSAGGGSSITQQLVKNLYLTDDCQIVDGQRQCVAPRTLKRKLKEITFALEVEESYSKDQILAWYLNSISYGGRYVGVDAAAEGYFHKPASQLTLAESALLAGIPAAPTVYHPRSNCAVGEDGECIVDDQGRGVVAGPAKERQEQVLRLMAQHGRASEADVDAAIADVVKVFPEANPQLAPAWIDDQVEPRLVRMCEAGLLPRTPGTDNCSDSIHSGAYRVTTTLDLAETTRAKAMMQQFIATGLQAGCDCHDAAIATIDPATGQVIVYAPSVDETQTADRRAAGDIDELTEINQPGSSFKPAVYLAWMDKLGKVPLSTLWDTSPMPLLDKPATASDQVTIVNPRPGGGGEGLITARAAMGGSQNVGAFRAASEVGVDEVIKMAEALGITTLDQQFDPTFRAHGDVEYGPAIATGGANIRAIDMAYMNATIANMGVMVGVPTLARTIDPHTLTSLEGASGDDLAMAQEEKLDFARGNTRLPGTRALDPVVVLQVRAADGTVLYDEGKDLQEQRVVNAGSVWLLHSIMSDCTARFIIWTCGSSNDDLSLDFYSDGVKVPGGIKTGTQQGPASANDTLATWMNGYTRYAATAVWVGNADKSLVKDGPSANYASADTTIRLFKNWMGAYHHDLKAAGVFSSPAGFDDLQPKNVVFKPFQTATTERGAPGGCSQMISGWQRTDVDYKGGDCLGKGCVPLPTLRKDLAQALAASRNIPACGANFVATPTGSPSPTVQSTDVSTLVTPTTGSLASPSVSPSMTTRTPSPQASPSATAQSTSAPASTRTATTAAAPSSSPTGS